MARTNYDCTKCPAYCCSYARIIVEDSDIERLAAHHGMEFKKARKAFTRKGEEKGERILRHQLDPHFTTICAFLDLETRGCTVYEARPEICREFPGKGRCGYWDFLTFERTAQEDPDWVATTG